jgi:hypothetical protein
MVVIPLNQYWYTGLKRLLKQTLKGIFWFVRGFFIGIPCLSLTPIQPVYFQTYLRKTIFGSEKSYDDANLTAIDWIRSGLGGSYIGNNWMGIVFLIFVLCIFLFLLVRYLQTRKLNSNILIIGIGLVFTLFIVIVTKRLWPHYLWTGYVFLWLGLILFIQSEINKTFKKVVLGLVLLFFGSSAFAFYSSALPSYLMAEKESKMEITESKALYKYVESEYKDIKIGLDGTTWYPYKYFVTAKAYHPFASERPVICKTCISWHPDQPTEIWENEVVIFNLRHPPNYVIEKKTNYTPANWEEIVEEFNRPAIVIGYSNELGLLKGSGRTYNGINI